MNAISSLNRLTFVLLFFFFSFSAQAQSFNYDWTVAGGSSGVDEAKGITIDSFKNVYAVGTFSGTVDFDPGIGVTVLTASGSSSGYIVKYDLNGQFQWVLKIGSSISASSTSIFSDTSNNIYVIGEINGVSGDFDPGPGVSTITSLGQTDVYIVKYTASGQFVWLQQFGGTLNEYARKIKAGKHNEILITCNFEGTVDFDPGPGTNNMTSAGSSDVFIARLYTNGVLDWVRTIGNSNGNQAPGIGIDELGSVYSVGSFSGTLDTNPDASATNFLTALGTSSDGLIIKLDSNGVFQWSHNLGSNSAAIVNDVEPDGNHNIYLTGWFAGLVDFDPGAALDTMTNVSGIDVFLLKMTYSGSHVWAKRTGNSLPDFYDGRSVRIDNSGNPYVLGIFEGTADFDPGIATNNESSLGDFDTFVWGLSSGGTYLFSESIGGTGKEVCGDLHIDDQNSIYFTGFFTAQVDFNPWAGTNFISPASSVADFHINKWTHCTPSTSTVIDSSCNQLYVFNGQNYTNSGTYTQTYTNFAGCDSIVTLGLTLVSIDTATTLTGTTITSMQNGATYQWYHCNGIWTAISNATLQSYTPTQNGQYAVVITFKGCSDTSGCLTVLGLGTDHIVGLQFGKLYPNPTNGDVYFDSGDIDFKGSISIYNMVGQLLEEITTSGDPHTIIHFNQPPGHYLVKIVSKDSEMNVPLIIH